MEVPSNLTRRELFSLSLAAAVPLILHPQRDWMAQFPQLAAYCKGLRKVPGGAYQLGNDTHADSERPRHAVTLSPFRLGATPVTVALWKEYCKATNAELPAAPVGQNAPGHGEAYHVHVCDGLVGMSQELG